MAPPVPVAWRTWVGQAAGQELGLNGNHSRYVRWVQASLNQINNAGLVVDGISGRRTRKAVRRVSK